MPIAMLTARSYHLHATTATGGPRTANRCGRITCRRRCTAAHAALTPAKAAALAAVSAASGGLPQLDAALDDELSRRPLALDAAGYFIIRVDSEARELVADWYTNSINEQGLACDPSTGEVISCKSGAARLPTRVWRGRTAKALSVAILERDHGFQPLTHLEHANYLGRELQRAEFALAIGVPYVQD